MPFSSSPISNLPKTSRGYHLHSPNINAVKNGFKDVLHEETHPLPPVGSNDVVVAVHAVSLNWRDIMIATQTYIRPFDPENNDGRVLCSDGAGEVVAVGDKVTRVEVGDHVAATFLPRWVDGLLEPEAMADARGSERDGMLREFAVLAEDEVVKVPKYLSFEEASTLPCAGVTAWNALFGHGGDRGLGRRIVAGETVLTQGTGGVGLFAAQLALAKGADVVATTSADVKADKIQDLVGVTREKIVNYKANTEWGAEVRKLTKNQKGVDVVVEVTGSQDSLKQSFVAMRYEGQISIIGTRGAAEVDGASKNMASSDILSGVLKYVGSTRRIAIGSRAMFEEMNAFLEEKWIRPVVDPKIYDFEQAREALMYMYQGGHFGNIVIRIKH